MLVIKFSIFNCFCLFRETNYCVVFNMSALQFLMVFLRISSNIDYDSSRYRHMES